MDKHAARAALKDKGFYQEHRGMLLIRDNELISCYQQLLQWRPVVAPARTEQHLAAR